MKDALPIIFIVLVFAAVIAFVLWKRHTKVKTWHGVPIPNHFKHEMFTPQGARVSSVVPVPAHVLDLIDDGINTQIEAVGRLKPTWTQMRFITDYRVFIIEPMGIYNGTNPTIIGAPQLITDVGAASATNLGAGNDGYKQLVIVIPHQQAQQWAFELYLRNGVRFESEHQACWTNDRDFYQQFVGQGHDIHPIFPDINGQ